MMRVGAVVRDLALLCLAVAVGWWLRGGATTAVQAQRSGSSGLAFQVTGAGPDALLTVYNTDNRTLYMYPRIGAGNSTVNCAFSLSIAAPGAPIQRTNCPMGELR